MTKVERTNLYYSIVLSLCWIHQRPITLPDLTGFLKMTARQLQKELRVLEEQGRIAKIPLRKKTNGRISIAWVIADNDRLPPEIRDVCQACGIGQAAENYGDERLCHRCFMAVKDNGHRISLTSDDEAEFSLWSTTIITMPNERILG